MSLYVEELKTVDIEAAVKTVTKLNDALSEKYAQQPNARLIVWVSDLHLHDEGEYSFGVGNYHENVDTSRQFRLCMNEIGALQMKPEVVVLGGDMTELGRPGEWDVFKKLYAEEVIARGFHPIPLLGNHDHLNKPDRNTILQLWPELNESDWPQDPEDASLYYSTIVNGLKYVIIDTMTQRKNKPLWERQLAWIEATLQDDRYPTIILSHIPLLPVGYWGDSHGMNDFVFMLNTKPHVLGVFSGHVHLVRFWQYYRKIHGTFPACAYGRGGMTGWGGWIMVDGRIDAIFSKQLYGKSYDEGVGPQLQDGSFSFIEPELFQKHPLCNPFVWSREEDPALRD